MKIVVGILGFIAIFFARLLVQAWIAEALWNAVLVKQGLKEITLLEAAGLVILGHTLFPGKGLELSKKNGGTL